MYIYIYMYVYIYVYIYSVKCKCSNTSKINNEKLLCGDRWRQYKKQINHSFKKSFIALTFSLVALQVLSVSEEQQAKTLVQ